MTIYTIEIETSIEQGRITIEVPPTIPDGRHRVVIHIDDPDESNPPLALPLPRMWDNWPADATFGREDLYDADGR